MQCAIHSACRSVCFCFLTLVCCLFLLSSGPLYLCGKLKSESMLFIELWVFLWCIIVCGLSDEDDGGWDRWDLFIYFK